MNPELDKYDVGNQTPPEVKLTLNVQEVNTIIAALAELPHRVSDALIRKVYTQANEQIPQQRTN
jgi:hypothetical protein